MLAIGHLRKTLTITEFIIPDTWYISIGALKLLTLPQPWGNIVTEGVSCLSYPSPSSFILRYFSALIFFAKHAFPWFDPQSLHGALSQMWMSMCIRWVGLYPLYCPLKVFAELMLKRFKFYCLCSFMFKETFFKEYIKGFLINTRVTSLIQILYCLKECQEKTVSALTFKNYTCL